MTIRAGMHLLVLGISLVIYAEPGKGANKDNAQSGKVNEPGDGNSGQGDDLNQKEKDAKTAAKGEWLKLREGNPERFQSQMRARLKELREDDPEHFQKIMKRLRALRKNQRQFISRHGDTAMDRKELRISLVASDETSPAEPAGGTNISSPAKAAGDSTSPDKTASSEVDLGWFVRSGAFFQTLSAYIAQQCVDPLMIALNARARSMQLQEARHNLKREKRHCCTPHARNRTNGRYPSGGVVDL